MTPFILAIAGGTGSGKSTIAEGIAQKYPDRTLVLHLDDYFRVPPELPKLHGYLNWDHPESVYSEQLLDDLQKLKQGQPTMITQKDPDGQRAYEEYHPRMRTESNPKPLIILEGFLALHYPELRKLYDLSVYLDAPFETHLSRRVHGFSKSYHQDVIKPMHEAYVQPSIQYADIVLDVARLDTAEVLKQVLVSIPAEVTTPTK